MMTWVWLDCLQINSEVFILFAETNQIFLKISIILTLHSGRSYYIDLLLIKMAVVAMFQENWSQFKIPSTNWQQFPKQGTRQIQISFQKISLIRQS